MGKHGPERIQRKDVTLCTIIYFDSDVIMPLQCGSFSCNTEDLGFALWICVIAYAGHRL